MRVADPRRVGHGLLPMCVAQQLAGLAQAWIARCEPFRLCHGRQHGTRIARLRLSPRLRQEAIDHGTTARRRQDIGHAVQQATAGRFGLREATRPHVTLHPRGRLFQQARDAGTQHRQVGMARIVGLGTAHQRHRCAEVAGDERGVRGTQQVGQRILAPFDRALVARR